MGNLLCYLCASVSQPWFVELSTASRWNYREELFAAVSRKAKKKDASGSRNGMVAAFQNENNQLSLSGAPSVIRVQLLVKGQY